MGPIKNTPLIIFLKIFLLVICFTNIFGLQYQEFKKEQEDKVLKNGQVVF